MHTRVTALLSLTLGVVLAAPSTGCRHTAQAAQPEPIPPGQVWLAKDDSAKRQIEVASVTEELLDGTLVTGGRVTFDDLRVAHVYSPVTGRVVEIKAHLGQRIKKGDPLATITSPDVGGAVADLRKADADLIAAEHAYRREKDLTAEGAGTQSALEAAEDAYRQAMAEKERTQEKVALLHAGGYDAQSQTYTVASPIDGEVVMRNINPGIEVQGQYGGNNVNELFTVGELDSVWVFADVYEADLARVHEGATCTVRTVAYNGRAFEGKVDWVAGMLDPTTRTDRVRCTFANPDHALKPEMYATAYLSVESRKALALPRKAVIQLGDQAVVFVKLADGSDGREHYERLPVAVDDIGSDQWLVLLHGLDAGQTVVTSGAKELTADL